LLISGINLRDVRRDATARRVFGKKNPGSAIASGPGLIQLGTRDLLLSGARTAYRIVVEARLTPREAPRSCHQLLAGCDPSPGLQGVAGPAYQMEPCSTRPEPPVNALR
jgi:hypothetical protein